MNEYSSDVSGDTDKEEEETKVQENMLGELL
jgi:hypothetical protein